MYTRSASSHAPCRWPTDRLPRSFERIATSRRTHSRISGGERPSGNAGEGGRFFSTILHASRSPVATDSAPITRPVLPLPRTSSGRNAMPLSAISATGGKPKSQSIAGDSPPWPPGPSAAAGPWPAMARGAEAAVRRPAYCCCCHCSQAGVRAAIPGDVGGVFMS